MALLTIPSQPLAKATNHTITLNKTDLFNISAISIDAYFSVQANVSRCIMEYNSDPGNQKEILTFDLSAASPTATFNVSARARSTFLLERIVLEDFDGGTLILTGAQIPSGFTITIAA
jgi:hypothetical protein